MVVIKNIFLLFIFLFSLNLIFADSFDVCSVNFAEPWFEVKDNLGNSLLVVDSDGDVFAMGTDHIQDDRSNSDSFEVGNSIHFNKDTSRYSNLNVGVNSFSNNGLLINVNGQGNVAQFSGSTINLKGLASLQGEKAGCGVNDGYYCNGENREYRDFFCDVTGSRSGICDFSVTSSYDCNNENYWTCDGDFKAIKDYTCSGSDCAPSGSYTSQVNCDVGDGYYCDGDDRIYRDNFCSSGSCTGTTSFVETCEFGCSGGSCGTCTPSYSCSGKSDEWVSNGCGEQEYCPSTPTCTSHSYYSCVSNGYVYWFNSCGVQEDVYDSCDMQCLNTGTDNYRCVECLDNNDCSPTHVCNDGNCITAPSGCTSNSDCSLGEVCDAGACRAETCNDVGLGSTTFTSTGHSRCVWDYVQHDQIAGSNNQLICWGVASFCENGCGGNDCVSNDLTWSSGVSQGLTTLSYLSPGSCSGTIGEIKTGTCSKDDSNIYYTDADFHYGTSMYCVATEQKQICN